MHTALFINIGAPQRRVVVISDCKAAVDAALAATRPHGTLPRASPALWARFRDMLAGRAVAFHWVPAHGRHEEWEPPLPHDGRLWRELNDSADQECTAHMLPHRRRWRQRLTNHERATAWCRKALEISAMMSQRLLEVRAPFADFHRRLGHDWYS